MRWFLLPLIVLGLLLAPSLYAQSNSYYGPEEIFASDPNADYDLNDPYRNPRQSQAAAAMQAQSQTQLNRPTLCEWWKPECNPETQLATSPASVGALHAAPTTTTDGNTQTTTNDDNEIGQDGGNTQTTFNPSMYQTIENFFQNLNGSDGYVTQSTAAHAGAPLAGTGPEAEAAALVMLGATGWTMWKARRMKQFARR